MEGREPSRRWRIVFLLAFKGLLWQLRNWTCGLGITEEVDEEEKRGTEVFQREKTSESVEVVRMGLKRLDQTRYRITTAPFDCSSISFGSHHRAMVEEAPGGPEASL